MARTKQSAYKSARSSGPWPRRQLATKSAKRRQRLSQRLASETEDLVAEHLPELFQASKEYYTKISQWNNLMMEDFNNHVIKILQALLDKKITFDIAFTAIAAQILHWWETVDGRQCDAEQVKILRPSYSLFLLHLVASCVDKKLVRHVPENNKFFQSNALLQFFNKEYLPQLTPEHIRFTLVIDQQQQIKAMGSCIYQLSRREAFEPSLCVLILRFADYSFAPFLRKINRLMDELDETSLLITTQGYNDDESNDDTSEEIFYEGLNLPDLLRCDVFVNQNISVHPLKYLSDSLLFELMFTCCSPAERYNYLSDFIVSLPICLYPEQFIGIVEETFRQKNMSTDIFVEWLQEYLPRAQKLDVLFCCSMRQLDELRKPYFSKLLAALEVTWSQIIEPYLQQNKLIMKCAFVDLLRSINFLMKLKNEGNTDNDLKQLIKRSSQICQKKFITTNEPYVQEVINSLKQQITDNEH